MRMPKNIGWKLGSLLAAILLWVALSAAPDGVATHAAPVLYRNLPPEWMVADNAPETIHIELRGTTRQLTAAALADTVAVFDLTDIKSAGDRTFTISESNLNLPPGVTFLRALPSQFRLRFARLAAKEVPVEIRFAGSLPAGYRLAGQSVYPDRLRIAGSEGRIAAVSSVQTDPIDLNGLTQSGDYGVDAFVADSQVHFESSPKVTVKLAIERTVN